MGEISASAMCCGTSSEPDVLALQPTRTFPRCDALQRGRLPENSGPVGRKLKKRRPRRVVRMAATDLPPNQTVYINNLNEKVKKDGTSVWHRRN